MSNQNVFSLLPRGQKPCEQPQTKIQQTKILVRRQIFGDLFLFGLVWQYSSIQKNIMKVGSKPWLLTCISNITLSLPSLYFSESKRELNFCNGYLSLLYFWFRGFGFQIFDRSFPLLIFFSNFNFKKALTPFCMASLPQGQTHFIHIMLSHAPYMQLITLKLATIIIMVYRKTSSHD